MVSYITVALIIAVKDFIVQWPIVIYDRNGTTIIIYNRNYTGQHYKTIIKYCPS